MNEAIDEMKITAVMPWYGGNRSLAATVGQQLGRLGWVGVPFAGGMPELLHIQTRAGVANDLHRHLINLARVIGNDSATLRMFELVDVRLYHPDEYEAAQRRCVEREKTREVPPGGLFGESPVPSQTLDIEWAADYFTCGWMGRGGSSGQEWEFQQNIATRWTASGGSSARRWRSAIDSLKAWTRQLRAWEFTCLDAFSFLEATPDREGQGLYLDPPWPEAGDQYKHRFTDKDQARLARKLATFKAVRVVVRFGDHPLIRALYPTSHWTWIEQESRNQEGNPINEVLILNGPSYAGGAA
jgi:DNA adenine methylase